MTAHGKGLSLLVLAAAACAPQPAETPLRSPSTDYPPPETELSATHLDLGADRQAPGDKLKNGATIAPNGLTPAGRPAPAEGAAGKAPSFGVGKPKPTPCADQGIVNAARDPNCWSGHSPSQAPAPSPERKGPAPAPETPQATPPGGGAQPPQ